MLLYGTQPGPVVHNFLCVKSESYINIYHEFMSVYGDNAMHYSNVNTIVLKMGVCTNDLRHEGRSSSVRSNKKREFIRKLIMDDHQVTIE